VPPVDTDTIVIGGGIAGAATAYELARAGCDVVLLEQFALGHAHGSSHGASRVFRLSYPDPAWVRLAQEAYTGWRALERELGEPLLRTTGSIDIGAHAARNARALASCGAPGVLLNPRQARERFGISIRDTETAMLQPDGGVLSAARALELLIEAARSHGARVHATTRAVSLEAGPDDVRVTLAGGGLTARAVVVAAGPWSSRLLAPLGIDLPVTPTRATVSYLGLAGAETLPVLIAETPPPAGGDGVLTYALADEPGTLKVGVHHLGPATDPDEAAEPDPWVGEWACEWAAALLPGRKATLLRSETCIYTNTDDERFVLERHERVVVASACSGHAFKFAPVTGRRVAALAAAAAS
jgi:sarcosine oxidase